MNLISRTDFFAGREVTKKSCCRLMEAESGCALFRAAAHAAGRALLKERVAKAGVPDAIDLLPG